MASHNDGISIFGWGTETDVVDEIDGVLLIFQAQILAAAIADFEGREEFGFGPGSHGTRLPQAPTSANQAYRRCDHSGKIGYPLTNRHAHGCFNTSGK